MRVLLFVILALALVAAPVRATGPRCGMKNTMAVAGAPGCCAMMKCCALPPKKAPQPTASSVREVQAVTLSAPTLSLLVRDVAPRDVITPLLSSPLGQGPSRFALFCTFLI